MALENRGPLTVGSTTFDPDVFFHQWAAGNRPLPQSDDLHTSILQTFNLQPADEYIYHAIASVQLSQVQQAINHGRGAGLHAWYRDGDGKVVRITAMLPLASLYNESDDLIIGLITAGPASKKRRRRLYRSLLAVHYPGKSSHSFRRQCTEGLDSLLLRVVPTIPSYASHLHEHSKIQESHQSGLRLLALVLRMSGVVWPYASDREGENVAPCSPRFHAPLRVRSTKLREP